MGNIAIFDAPTDIATVRRQSRLADKMGSSGTSLRRIQTNTNGTFRRIVNGEKLGRAVAGAIDVIFVDLLPEVSRQFYASSYDPDAAPTLPDCWSNLGDKPEPNAPRKQATSCSVCPKNVDGSGARGKGKACRFLRRTAVLLVGDPSGEVYQLNFAAMSLFGKGVGNVHPFEAYKKFLVANGEGLDTVVTRVMYDTEADTMQFKFKAVRHLTAGEIALVDAAQADPETDKYIRLTAGQMDGAKAPAPAPVDVSPTSVEASAGLFDADDEEEVEVPAPVAEEAPPKKRASKKAAEEAPAQAKPALESVLSAWLDDEEDSEEVPF